MSQICDQDTAGWLPDNVPTSSFSVKSWKQYQEAHVWSSFCVIELALLFVFAVLIIYSLNEDFIIACFVFVWERIGVFLDSSALSFLLFGVLLVLGLVLDSVWS